MKKPAIIRTLFLLVIGLFLLSFSVSAVSPAKTTEEKAEALAELGLFRGKGTNWDPALSDSATRNEAATMLIRLLGQESEAAARFTDCPFGDVPDWAQANVTQLYHDGYVNGIGGNLYGGGYPITAQQFSALLLRCLGYSETEGDFSYDVALPFAVSKGLLTKEQADAFSGEFLREGMVELCYNALSCQMNQSGDTLEETLSKARVFDRTYPPVSELTFQRLSSRKIQLSWPDDADPGAISYRVLRQVSTGGPWSQIAELPSDAIASGASISYTDELSGSSPQQYRYRVDIVTFQKNAFDSTEGTPRLASNIRVCLDPGHYKGSSVLEGEELYDYGEGIFTLKIGMALWDILRDQYGIDVRMTRTSDDIDLMGYQNQDLDKNHLSLRGRYAEGCDFFLSLHTNANTENANGYPTCSQSLAINKVIILANQLAADSDVAIRQANTIGQKLTDVNYSLNLSESNRFISATKGNLLTWTEEYNDSLGTVGTVCYRQTSKNTDYYGVLRGANAEGVPGLIIEHGYHTVAALRKEAMSGNLAQLWAEADAAGIAAGYDFIRQEK